MSCEWHTNQDWRRGPIVHICLVFSSTGDRVVRRFCGPHKEAGHVDVMTKRRDFDGCEKQPTFGSPDDYASQEFDGCYKLL